MPGRKRTEGGILSSSFEARRRAGFVVAVFASLLTLPLFLADTATGEEPEKVVTATTGDGFSSVQDLWVDLLAEVVATSTTTTTVVPMTTAPPPRVTTAPPRPHKVAPPATTVPPPPPPPPPTSQDGLASWYELEGAKSGVCAHRSLPFGTVLTVTAVNSGASVTCIVGDRGPFAAKLIVDLFRDDFAVIAPVGAGVIAVHITW